MKLPCWSGTGLLLNVLKLPCWLGTGSIVKCVETAACRPPDAICGKPFRPMADVVIKANGIDPSRTLMIGDRLGIYMKKAALLYYVVFS